MNRTTIIASGIAVLALGLGTWSLVGPKSSADSGQTVNEDDSARFSSRPASKVGAPRTTRHSNSDSRPGGPIKFADRSTPPPTDETRAAQNLNRLLTPQQKASLAAARQQAINLPPSLTTKQARVTSNRIKDITKMQEDLRTAVKTNPDRWIETYDSLNRNFNQGNRPFFGGGGGSGIIPDTAPDPVEPTTPEPTNPEPINPAPTEPSEPVLEAPELPLPLEETQRLAEIYRAELENSLQGPTDREDRFQPLKK